MDINAIRAKLDALNNTGQQREKTDYSEIFWKPELGKQTVRLYRLLLILPIRLRN